jgi:hypothetical protein
MSTKFKTSKHTDRSVVCAFANFSLLTIGPHFSPFQQSVVLETKSTFLFSPYAKFDEKNITPLVVLPVFVHVFAMTI